MTPSALRPAALILAGLLPLTAGCSVSVDKDEAGRNKDVSVKTPFANVNVKASADTPPDTELPVHAAYLRLLTRGAEVPGEVEQRTNPRSASARLRAAERLPAPNGAPA